MNNQQYTAIVIRDLAAELCKQGDLHAHAIFLLAEQLVCELGVMDQIEMCDNPTRCQNEL